MIRAAASKREERTMAGKKPPDDDEDEPLEGDVLGSEDEKKKGTSLDLFKGALPEPPWYLRTIWGQAIWAESHSRKMDSFARTVGAATEWQEAEQKLKRVLEIEGVKLDAEIADLKRSR